MALPDDGTVSNGGGTVTLDGSGSGGPWGTNVTYGWALTDPASGVTVTFDDAASATPVVTIPALATDPELTFTLTVTGRGGTDGIAPATDTATVTAMLDPTLGICGRTLQVRDALVAQISGVSHCADVTAPHLAAITGTLSVSTTAIAAGDFDGLTGLTQLLLSSNRLATLPDGVFDELTALTVLRLGNNRLATLPDGVFDGLTALTGLYLFNNALATLPDGVFDGLTALTVLTVASNDLTTLDDDVFDGPTSLTTLFLDENDLPTLPADVFEPLTALTDLDLRDNPGAPFAPEAVALPDDGTVSNGGGTVTLDGSGSGGPWGTNVTYGWALTDPASGVTVTFDDAASATPVVTIPALATDPELTFTLTVTGRGGTDGIAPATDTATVTAMLDPTLGICGRTLQVRDALVAQIPGVSHCADVTAPDLAAITGTLLLSGENITALAAGDFEGLTALTSLALNRNGLTALPADVFNGLTALTSLVLSYNDLATLDDDVFDGLTALTDLSLGYNDLATLPADVFDGLTSLEGLHLSYNDLATLLADVFDGLTALTDLSLGYNDLATLPDDVFDGLTALTDLSLSANDLTTLPDDVFEPLTALTDLALRGNPGAPFAPEAVALPDDGTVSNGGGTVTLDGSGSGSGGPWGTNVTYGWALTDPTSGVTVTFDDAASAMPVVTIPALATGTGLTFTLTVTGRGGTDGIAPATDTATVTAILDPTGGICGRPLQVRDALVALIPSVSHCADVTATHLAAITGTLTLNSVGLTALAAGDFDGLTSLRRLFLADNALATLPDGVFDGLTALMELHLQNNRLTTLPDDVFEPLTALSELYLQNNALATLPDGVFDGLTALMELYLQDNQLTMLPDDVFEPLTALTRMTLRGNPGASFAPEAVALPDDGIVSSAGGMVTLDGSGSGGPWGTNVTYGWALTDPVSGVTVTFDDDTSATPVVTIPALAKDTELTFTLTVTGRGGTDGIAPATDTATVTVDPGICGRTLDVRNALVDAISGVSHCAHVTTTHLAAITGALRLINNDITRLAAGDFDGLTSLLVLGLQENNLTTLPDGVFDDLTSLINLTLQNNKLTTLDDDVFQPLTALSSLTLEGNRLTTLDAGMFAGLTGLTHLDLGSNQLTTVPDDMFDGLTALTSLALDFNHLATLDAGVFDELTALTDLSLASNQLTTLPDDVFEPLTALTSLRLGGNPGAPFAPEAVALPDDGTVSAAGGMVTLDGSGSDGGPWGTNVTYGWALTDPVSGVTVTFDDDTSATPVVTIPALAEGTGRTFTLTVTGRGGTDGIVPATDTATVTAISDDATLSALTVNDGTNDLTLAPAFASGTFAYAADVAHAVDEVTLSATVNHAGASVSAVTLNGTAVADGDFTDGITVSGLLVDGNEIVVTVTAQDTSTTRTYTVTVTRAANAAPTALAASVTTDEDTAYTFAAADFNFTDSDGDALASVTVVTLPAEGALELDATALVTPGQSVPAADIGKLVFTPAANGNGAGYASFTFRVHDGTDESASSYVMTVNVTAMNDPATGAPTISGTAQVGETLTAATTAIADVDGLTSPTYGYQWVRVDADGTSNPTDITGATSATYKQVEADVGRKLRVKVSFTDDDGNDEERTSAPTATETVLDPTVGICGRTPQVRDALVAKISGVSNCADVTAPHLAAITGTLELSGQQIIALAVGDFAVGDFVGLTSLTHLSLYSNALTTLPTGVFAELTALTELLLGSNQLSTLPDGVFDGLTRLETLALHNNALTMLDAGVFDGLTSLTSLNLHGTKLAMLSDDVFEPLTALAELLLGGNSLTTLPAEVFNGLTSLTVLRLARNELTTLDAGVFDGLTSLTQLYLNNNELTTLDDDVFEPLTALIALTLRGNPGAPFAPDAVALPDDGTVPAAGGMVTLDGSGSDGGPWGTNVTYGWALTDPVSGVTVTFDDDTSATPEVTIPALTAGTGLTFTLTVTGRGGTDGIVPATDTATVTATASNDATLRALTVNDGTNDLTLAPTFASGTFAYAADVAHAVDEVTLSATVNHAGASVSAVTLNGTAVADSDFTDGITVSALLAGGNDIVVTVTAEDTSTTRTYTVTVTANTAPTALDALVTTNEDTAYTFGAADFNFDDTDTGDALASVTVVTLPAEGSLTLDGPAVTTGQLVPAADIGKLVFTPVANGNGDAYASFTFRVHDGTDESASSYVMTVNVTAMNDPATGAPTISGTAQVGQTLTAATAGIADVDGLTSPTYGYRWIRVDADGTSNPTDITGATLATYTPVRADVGNKLRVTVSFTDDDGSGEELTSAPTATVLANTAPRASASSVTTNEDTAHTFAAADFNFTDSDGNALASVTVVTLPTEGSLTLDGPAVMAGQSVPAADIGKLVFTPAANGNGDAYASFTFRVHDGTDESASAYTMTVNVTAMNDPATGAPTISGTARVGQTLTAATTGVADVDGLPSSFTYQWIRVDADGTSNEMSIQGAIASTYILTHADMGRKLMVKVSFTDDGGGDEELTSDAYPASVMVTPPVSGFLVSNRSQGNSSTHTSPYDRAQRFTTAANSNYILSSIEIVSADDESDDVNVEVWTVGADGFPSARHAALTSPGSFAKGTLAFTARANTLLEADTTYAVLIQSPGGQELKLAATQSDLEDFGGAAGWSIVDGHDYRHGGTQWTSLTLNALRITVKGSAASFIAANAAPTASDASVTTDEDTAYTFAAADFNFTDSDGNALASVTVVTLPTEGSLTLDGPAVTAGQSVPAADIGKLAFTPAPNAHGDAHARFTFRVHDGTDESAASYVMTVNVTAMNDPATGAPTISGTAQVGQTLTAATTGIADVDGLTSPTYGYQWIRVDADGTSNPTDIAGAASGTYTPVTADVGKKLRVKVSFTDDDSNDDELTSAATATVLANTAPRASASSVTTNEDTAHTFAAADFNFTDSDGNALASVTVVTLPGEGALTLDGTAVTTGQSVPAADIGKLAFTPAANAHGDAYASFTFRVHDGTDESAAAYTMTVNVTAMNDSATGAPTISGTAQVSQTLTAATTGIADVDGLTSPTYGYQWIRVDADGTSNPTDITGATLATYTPVRADVGNKLRVKVSFTDDDSNDEERTSDAYPASGTVEAPPNAAPSFTSSATFDAAENQTVVGTVAAADGDPGDSVTGYAIQGGADASRFTIVEATGELTFVSAPNFEAAADADTDNDYVVVVRATSGTGVREKTADQTITVTVTDEAGEAPGAPATPSVSSASVSSVTVAWAAPSNAGPPIADYDYRYRVKTPQGSWTEVTSTPITALGATIAGLAENTEYEVQVRATNAEGTGGWSDPPGSGSTDANAAAPSFTSSATFDAAENQTVVGTVAAADGDAGDSVTGYAIQGGADAARFTIVEATGELAFTSAPNFEAATDADTNNDYVVVVRATSGTGERLKTADQTITVTVTDEAGEAPGAPATPSVSSASVSSVTVTWAAPSNAGPPIADYDYRYRVKAPQGSWTEVTSTPIPGLSVAIAGLAEDTEYEVQVRATNAEGTGDWSDPPGSGSTDANAAPSFTSSATFDAAENQTVVGTVAAADGDPGDSVTGYAIQGGADAARFTIVASTGELAFTSAPNFEAATDADTNNDYVVVVRATSGTGERLKTADQTITVTVTDEAGEAPGAPATPSVSSASVSSVTVTWAAPSNAGPPIADYDYRYRVKAPQGSWTEVTSTPIPGLSVAIAGLAEDTEYEVQVRATNAEGTGDWSDPRAAVRRTRTRRRRSRRRRRSTRRRTRRWWGRSRRRTGTPATA